MGEWRPTTIGHFISLQRGHDLPKRERNAGTIPVIGSGGIVGYHDKPIVSSPGITIGRATNLGMPKLIQEDFWPLNTTLYVTNFHGNDVRFSYYLLRTLDLTGFNSGSVQPMLNRNYIADVPIVVPEPQEQCAISGVLGALDDKIAMNERIETIYEHILGLEFELLQIDVEPEPSRRCVVNEMIDFNPRLNAPAGQAIYLDMAALPTATARVKDLFRRKPKPGTRFANGDTIMARITPCLENGKTGFVDFMKDGEVGIGSTEFIVMRARPGIPSHLPYFLARSPRFRNNAIRNMIGSSGRQRVSAAQLLNFPVRHPNESELADFTAAASIAFAHMKSLGAESMKLAELRDTLLPKLMSGEIRVRDAEKAVEEVT